MYAPTKVHYLLFSGVLRFSTSTKNTIINGSEFVTTVLCQYSTFSDLENLTLKLYPIYSPDSYSPIT